MSVELAEGKTIKQLPVLLKENFPDLDTVCFGIDIGAVSYQITLQDIITCVEAESGPPVAATEDGCQDFVVAIDGDTVFVLTQDPVISHSFYVDGVRYFEGTHYTAVDDTYTWLDVLFTLTTVMDVRICYNFFPVAP